MQTDIEQPTLRDFLALLEQHKQLLRIHDKVYLEPDLGAAACALTQIGTTSPAVIFDTVQGYRAAQVVLNVHGSCPNHALALGMAEDTSIRALFFEFVRRCQQYPGPLEYATDAPWQEVAIDQNLNLFEHLPLFRLNRGDGGFYIDKACIVSRDPDDWNNDDVENVGIYRLQVKGANQLGIQPVPQHDIAIHLAHAEARGQDLPIAIAIGNDPIITLAGGMPILYKRAGVRNGGSIARPRVPCVEVVEWPGRSVGRRVRAGGTHPGRSARAGGSIR
jgi:UbiD family decarboxylase